MNYSWIFHFFSHFFSYKCFITLQDFLILPNCSLLYTYESLDTAQNWMLCFKVLFLTLLVLDSRKLCYFPSYFMKMCSQSTEPPSGLTECTCAKMCNPGNIWWFLLVGMMGMCPWTSVLQSTKYGHVFVSKARPFTLCFWSVWPASLVARRPFLQTCHAPVNSICPMRKWSLGWIRMRQLSLA